MWKAQENDEYEAASPAVQAHFHALRTEDALRREDFATAEREGRLASDRFVQAASGVGSKRTVDALLLLAENYEYRAKVASARISKPTHEESSNSDRRAGRSSFAGNDSAGSDKSRLKGEAEDADVGGANDPDTMTRQSSLTTNSKSAASIGSGGDGGGGTDSHDPAVSAAAETQLNLAAAEMEELWRKLQEIGLSSAGSSDKSFGWRPRDCNRWRVDAASGSRVANAKPETAQRSSSSPSSRGNTPPRGDGSGGIADRSPQANTYGGLSPHDRRSSSSSIGGVGTAAAPGALQSASSADIEGLQETIAHQKYEIVRLLNTVKTLSSENTKLLKSENKEIQESMEKFKGHYNQKLVMIKRALEEWRRQRNSNVNNSSSASPTSQRPGDSAQLEQRNAALEKKLKLQEQQLTQLSESVKTKDEQLAKYEKWYKTLKAGAKAKQRSQSGANGGGGGGGGGASSMSMSSSMDGGGFGGSSVVPKDSFTSSSSISSFQDYSGSSSDDASGGGLNGGRPPAHPNRRAL